MKWFLIGLTFVTSLSWGGTIAEYKKAYLRPKTIPYPENNKYSKDREVLGKMLFFDPRLSGSKVMSCATCHNPSFNWGDSLPKGVGHGHKSLARRSPTILNLAFGELMFWDGRAASLEEQSLGPIQSEGEMNQKLEAMQSSLNVVSGYKPYFEKAYPGEGINPTTVSKAIATYERGVISGTAPFDRWINGDEKAISESAKRGFLVFNEAGKCTGCHKGWNFTDHSFHDIGVTTDDEGRFKILPLESMKFAFKTPTLRNVAERGPYMHNGSEKSLEEVVELYNLGGKEKRPSLSKLITPLNLTIAQKTDLINFLKTLTSKDKPVELPLLPL